LALHAGYVTAGAPRIASPYTAYVREDGASVRSGPDGAFYETDRLAAGTKVEVYRQDQGGWFAIRPPQESFSWVAAQHVEITENPAVGRVVSDTALTRVGSRFNDVHDVEYIRLRRDELVEVIGERVLKEPDGAKPSRWYKIAPPAGEFRWIHRDALSLKPLVPVEPTSAERPVDHEPATDKAIPRPASHEQVTAEPLDLPPVYHPPVYHREDDRHNSGEATKISPSSNETDSLVPQLGDDESSSDADFTAHAASIADARQAGDAPQDSTFDSGDIIGAQPEGTSIEREFASDSGWEFGSVEELHSEAGEASPQTSDEIEKSTPGAPESAATHPPDSRLSNDTTGAWRVTETNDHSRRSSTGRPDQGKVSRPGLGELNLQLSQEIMKPIGQWQLEMIHEGAVRLLAAAQTEPARLAAEEFVTKIDEFQRLQTRRRQTPELLAADGSRLGATSPTQPNRLPDFELDEELVAGIDRTVPRFVAPQSQTRENQPAPVSILAPGKQRVALVNHYSTPPARETASPFTATGWLIPVRSKKANMPRLAITDREGRILDFVAVPQGANLTGMLGKEVGVIGKRGFSTRLQKSQLLASRIVLLPR
jgi:hypothetical protein